MTPNTSDQKAPAVDFGVPTDERWAFETEARGYCGMVRVSFSEREVYRLTFYDPVRLAQDLEEEGLIADPGLVVLPKITESAMQAAITRLVDEGFFATLRSSAP